MAKFMKTLAVVELISGIIYAVLNPLSLLEILVVALCSFGLLMSVGKIIELLEAIRDNTTPKKEASETAHDNRMQNAAPETKAPASTPNPEIRASAMHPVHPAVFRQGDIEMIKCPLCGAIQQASNETCYDCGVIFSKP